MSDAKEIEVWFSIQSDYCYFLVDRLLRLSDSGVEIVIRPVLGMPLRMPEMTKNRGALEHDYFVIDAKRTAAFLGLPHVHPDLPPIQFEPRSVWIASKEQPRIERLYRSFVGANRAG